MCWQQHILFLCHPRYLSNLCLFAILENGIQFIIIFVR